ncbi:MAG TPA: insulinase family protein, partial [Candidatus Kapabacteria bacterium]
MKFYRILLLALSGVAASIIMPHAASAQLPPWTRFTLDNGLQVLVVENHLVPIATIEIAVKNGS